MRALTQVDQFAARAQRRPWCVSWMARSAGLQPMSWPFSERILGVLVEVQGLSFVAINQRLDDSRLAIPVLAHELAHRLLGEQPTCTVSAAGCRTEQVAWLGAARLVVSQPQGDQVAAGRLSVEAVAESVNVPPTLAALGLTLVQHRINPSTAEVRRAVDAWAWTLAELAGELEVA